MNASDPTFDTPEMPRPVKKAVVGADEPPVVRTGLSFAASARRRRHWATVALIAIGLIAGSTPVGAVATTPNERPVPSASADVLVLDGHGNGHGIGLSQWGAYGYAIDQGWSADQILDHYYGGTVASTVTAGSITVRLMNIDDQQTAIVNDGAHLVVDGVAGGPWQSVVARETGPGSYTVSARSDLAVCPTESTALDGAWTTIASGLGSVTVRPDSDTSTSTNVADLLAVCEPSGRVRSYRGTIRAINGTDGENRTVNEVPVEQYLRSVVATEMSESWAAAGGGRGMQALRAQAIAARSYGLAESRYSYAKTCDLVCQSYPGAAWRASIGAAYTRIEYPGVDAAVSTTAGSVRRMGSPSGAIATAMFSASSGGWTAASTLGFPAVEDIGDSTAKNPYFRWTASISAAALEKAWPAIGTYTGISVTKRSGQGDWGGRVTSMLVQGSSGSVAITGDQFRSALALKSNWFLERGSTDSPSDAQPLPGPPGERPSTDPCAGRLPPKIGAVRVESPPARLTAISPVRLVDTRDGTGTTVGALGRGCTIVVRPPVPDGTTAVAINITADNTTNDGFISAYPCGVERTLTASVQPIAGAIIGGSALVPLGDDGTFCVFSNVPTDVVIDLFGVFAPAGVGRFEPLEVSRRLDTRTGSVVPAGTITRIAMRGADASGLPGAGADATAVAVTLHAMEAVAGGYVTAWPCDAAQPFVSAANVGRGESITNHVEVALSASGEVCLFNSAPMHLAVDLAGWYGPSGSTDFHAVTPYRLADTRVGQGWTGRFGRNENRAIAVGGTGTLPTGASVRAVAAQITAVEAAGSGYVIVHPCRSPVPQRSVLRYPASINVGVLVTGSTDAAGRVCVVSNTATQIVVDVSGWFG